MKVIELYNSPNYKAYHDFLRDVKYVEYTAAQLYKKGEVHFKTYEI